MHSLSKAASSETISPSAATAHKAIAVFDLIGNSDRPLAFKELVNLSGLPKATLHRMLGALTETGLVSFDTSSKTYWLGMRLVDLANKIWERIDLSGAFERELSHLKKISGYSAQLAMIDGFQIVYLDERAPLDEIRLYYQKGRRLPAYCTAIGKAILASQNLFSVHTLVNKHELVAYTLNTITNWPALQRELALVKERGYAIDDEEHTANQRCIAAPIRDHRGVAIAALGLTATATQLSLKECHTLAPEVIAAAERISFGIGTVGASKPQDFARVTVTPDERVKCIFPDTNFLGDSPVWKPDTKTLIWVDILAPSVQEGDPATAVVSSQQLPSLVGAVALRTSGGLVAAMQNGFATVGLLGTEPTPMGDPESHLPQNRFNDGKCDSSGRFWAGTMSMVRDRGRGSLYRLDPTGDIHLVDTGHWLCNGIEWSLDDRLLFLADSLEGCIYAYDYDRTTGSVKNRRVHIAVPETDGILGGLTIDQDNCLWAVLSQSGRLVRIDPQGQIVTSIPMPVPHPMGVTFGGEKSDTLFVTSARLRLTTSQINAAPLSGSVFSVASGRKGRAANQFAG
ncbi:SMP-30/gluconolactonase/LRE family protein [Microvirga antarctica]|uniref:SMP-30/gluconolactonase/LRE family protein n=1 Tax=Microvirga antarctica TaxID=2819233 RepID=UPI001B3044DE|nr:SMP-30/gluconolactonase/LRE family protein [Microvirga antarctica]